MGILVDENFKGDDKVNIGSISSGGKYLVFIIDHTRNGINEFWNSFIDILAKNNYQFNDEKPILERYAPTLIDKGLCEMCVPIK